MYSRCEWVLCTGNHIGYLTSQMNSNVDKAAVDLKTALSRSYFETIDYRGSKKGVVSDTSRVTY